MLKYRILIASNSRYLQVVRVTWVVVLCLSVWSWKTDVMLYQVAIQWFTTLFILVVVSRIFRARLAVPIFLLDDTGQVLMPKHSQQQRQISAQSRIVGPFIYMVLCDSYSQNAVFVNWLARDQLSEPDFCRLCKVIYRCQSSPIE